LFNVDATWKRDKPSNCIQRTNQKAWHGTKVLLCKCEAGSSAIGPEHTKINQILLVTPFANTKARKKEKQAAKISLEKHKNRRMLRECNLIM
jgi:hypothetical protein